MRPENNSEDDGNDANDDNIQGDTIVKEIFTWIASMLKMIRFVFNLLF